MCAVLTALITFITELFYVRYFGEGGGGGILQGEMRNAD